MSASFSPGFSIPYNAHGCACARVVPAIGYALSDVALDRVSRYNLLLFGHMANYQSRGTFHSTEQLSLFGSAPSNFRSYYTMAEYDISFCVPSAMLVAHMLKAALVVDERDAVTPTIWLMKMAPRRWFKAAVADGTTPAVDVRDAMTSAGRLSYQIFNVKPHQLRVDVSLAGPAAGSLLKMRLRDEASMQHLTIQEKSGAACGGTWSVDAAAQTVDVQLPKAPATLSPAGSMLLLNCTVTVGFE
jgi:hypothetical protein